MLAANRSVWAAGPERFGSSASAHLASGTGTVGIAKGDTSNAIENLTGGIGTDTTRFPWTSPPSSCR